MTTPDSEPADHTESADRESTDSPAETERPGETDHSRETNSSGEPTSKRTDADASTPGVGDIDDNSMPQDLRDEVHGDDDENAADVPNM